MSQLDSGPRAPQPRGELLSQEWGARLRCGRHGPTSHILAPQSDIGHQRVPWEHTEPPPRPAKSLDSSEMTQRRDEHVCPAGPGSCLWAQIHVVTDDSGGSVFCICTFDEHVVQLLL